MLASDDQDVSIGSLSMSFASDIVELVILTVDEGFLQTLRQAVGGARRCWHVPSPDKVSDLLIAGQVGIVILDVQALHEAPGSFVAQIKRQFPDLVILAAGKRDDETALGGLITNGVIYRFIHKPMSPARAKLFVDAAVKKNGERRRSSLPPRRALPQVQAPPLAALVLLGAFLCCLAVGVGFWAWHRGDTDVPARTPAAELPAPATKASSHGSVREQQEQLLTRAENAVLEERLDEAEASLDAARRAGADSTRLTFLTSQLAKARQEQRAAHRAKSEGRPAAAHGEERLTPLLELAEQRTREGHLIEPDGDCAKFYVTQAVRNNPNNAAAQAAEQALALALLADARGAIARHDFAHAVSVLDAAEGIASRTNIDNLLQLLRAARRTSDVPAPP
jgi:hypothetical protein